MPDAEFWHGRYLQQARWTQDLRNYLYPRIGIDAAQRALDLGCGTGALVQELIRRVPGRLIGLDINKDNLDLAVRNAPGAGYVLADGHHLPFSDESFDVSLCHLVLLWLKDPQQAVEEMRRVTRTGGTVLALAEPDYGGRVDYPPELAILGDWQQVALRHQGAEPYIGRRLAELFCRAGLQDVQTGVLGGQWRQPSPEQEWELEWAVLEDDLKSIPEQWQPDQVDRLRRLDWETRQHGERVQYVPMFYAWGKVA